MGDTVIIEDEKPAKPDTVVVVQPERDEKVRQEKTTVTETVRVTKTEH